MKEETKEKVVVVLTYTVITAAYIGVSYMGYRIMGKEIARAVVKALPKVL